MPSSRETRRQQSPTSAVSSSRVDEDEQMKGVGVGRRKNRSSEGCQRRCSSRGCSNSHDDDTININGNNISYINHNKGAGNPLAGGGGGGSDSSIITFMDGRDSSSTTILMRRATQQQPQQEQQQHQPADLGGYHSSAAAGRTLSDNDYDEFSFTPIRLRKQHEGTKQARGGGGSAAEKYSHPFRMNEPRTCRPARGRRRLGSFWAARYGAGGEEEGEGEGLVAGAYKDEAALEAATKRTTTSADQLQTARESERSDDDDYDTVGANRFFLHPSSSSGQTTPYASSSAASFASTTCTDATTTTNITTATKDGAMQQCTPSTTVASDRSPAFPFQRSPSAAARVEVVATAAITTERDPVAQADNEKDKGSSPLGGVRTKSSSSSTLLSPRSLVRSHHRGGGRGGGDRSISSRSSNAHHHHEISNSIISNKGERRGEEKDNAATTIYVCTESKIRDGENEINNTRQVNINAEEEEEESFEDLLPPQVAATRCLLTQVTLPMMATQETMRIALTGETEERVVEEGGGQRAGGEAIRSDNTHYDIASPSRNGDHVPTAISNIATKRPTQQGGGSSPSLHHKQNNQDRQHHRHHNTITADDLSVALSGAAEQMGSESVEAEAAGGKRFASVNTLNSFNSDNRGESGGDGHRDGDAGGKRENVGIATKDAPSSKKGVEGEAEKECGSASSPFLTSKVPGLEATVRDDGLLEGVVVRVYADNQKSGDGAGGEESIAGQQGVPQSTSADINKRGGDAGSKGPVARRAQGSIVSFQSGALFAGVPSATSIKSDTNNNNTNNNNNNSSSSGVEGNPSFFISPKSLPQHVRHQIFTAPALGSLSIEEKEEEEKEEEEDKTPLDLCQQVKEKELPSPPFGDAFGSRDRGSVSSSKNPPPPLNAPNEPRSQCKKHMEENGTNNTAAEGQTEHHTVKINSHNGTKFSDEQGTAGSPSAVPDRTSAPNAAANNCQHHQQQQASSASASSSGCWSVGGFSPNGGVGVGGGHSASTAGMGLGLGIGGMFLPTSTNNYNNNNGGSGSAASSVGGCGSSIVADGIGLIGLGFGGQVSAFAQMKAVDYVANNASSSPTTTATAQNNNKCTAEPPADATEIATRRTTAQKQGPSPSASPPPHKKGGGLPFSFPNKNPSAVFSSKANTGNNNTVRHFGHEALVRRDDASEGMVLGRGSPARSATFSSAGEDFNHLAVYEHSEDEDDDNAGRYLGGADAGLLPEETVAADSDTLLLGKICRRGASIKGNRGNNGNTSLLEKDRGATLSAETKPNHNNNSNDNNTLRGKGHSEHGRGGMWLGGRQQQLGPAVDRRGSSSADIRTNVTQNSSGSLHFSPAAATFARVQFGLLGINSSLREVSLPSYATRPAEQRGDVPATTTARIPQETNERRQQNQNEERGIIVEAEADEQREGRLGPVAYSDVTDTEEDLLMSSTSSSSSLVPGGSIMNERAAANTNASNGYLLGARAVNNPRMADKSSATAAAASSSPTCANNNKNKVCGGVGVISDGMTLGLRLGAYKQGGTSPLLGDGGASFSSSFSPPSHTSSVHHHTFSTSQSSLGPIMPDAAIMGPIRAALAPTVVTNRTPKKQQVKDTRNNNKKSLSLTLFSATHNNNNNSIGNNNNNDKGVKQCSEGVLVGGEGSSKKALDAKLVLEALALGDAGSGGTYNNNFPTSTSQQQQRRVSAVSRVEDLLRMNRKGLPKKDDEEREQTAHDEEHTQHMNANDISGYTREDEKKREGEGCAGAAGGDNGCAPHLRIDRRHDHHHSHTNPLDVPSSSSSSSPSSSTLADAPPTASPYTSWRDWAHSDALLAGQSGGRGMTTLLPRHREHEHDRHDHRHHRHHHHSRHVDPSRPQEDRDSGRGEGEGGGDSSLNNEDLDAALGLI